MYGKTAELWDDLTDVACDFLVERARLKRPTSYTELNTVLHNRVGVKFDFEQASDRAAMGHLLGLVVERTAGTGLMLSALVHYLNANDAGPGFYSLARTMGLLRRRATADERLAFWIEQLNGLYAFYRRR